ncbi:preprotein translocase subunit YajC [Gordonia sp. VNK21]|uniref:preprotein translocase subunit YajC n=1 Tax=Gordonia sp. VNK21 TaxID=3382483 RepID=UPI0038D47B68
MDQLLFPLLLALAAAFLFMSFRNQKKRAAAMTEMQNQAVSGARVQLHAGLFGTIVGDSEGPTVDVEIAPGVVTTWNRLAIREVVSDDAETFDDLENSEFNELEDTDFDDLDVADPDESGDLDDPKTRTDRADESAKDDPATDDK